MISNNSLSSLIKSMKEEEKVIESPKLIMDRFLNGCHERVWESSHESLCSVPSPQGQSTGKFSDHHQEDVCEDADPAPGSSHLDSDIHSTVAQHYTIPLQAESLARVKVGVDSYIPSGGSSGYGTCSDHYFESGSSASMSGTSDYFKLRLVDVAECNSLSTCEEEGNQTVVEVANHSGDTSSHPVLECSLTLEAAQCNATRDKESPNTPCHLTLPLKCLCTSKYNDLTTHHIDNSSTCNITDPPDRQGSLSDYAPSTLPPEHYFTDNEGYLRFTKETAV